MIARKSISAFAARFLSAVVFGGGCLASAENITIVYTAQVGALGEANGGDLGAGSLVKFGFFDASPEEVEENAFDLDYLLDRFRGISETSIGLFDGEGIDFGEGPVYFDGVFAQSVSLDPSQTVLPGFEGGIVGARPYLWGFNAASVGEATEHGIFSDADWAIQATGSGLFELDDVSPASEKDLYVGSFDPGGSLTLAEQAGNLHRLVAIPEPDAMILLAAVVLWGLGRRRRPSRTREVNG